MENITGNVSIFEKESSAKYVSEIIEIAYLTFILIFGLPLNAYSLFVESVWYL